MKCYFYLSRKNENCKGLSPVVCRIVNSKRDEKDLRTGVFIKASRWNATDGMPANSNCNEARRLALFREKIDAIILQCERESLYSAAEAALRYKAMRKPLLGTIQDIKAEWATVVKPNKRLNDKMDKMIEQFVAGARVKMVRLIVQETLKGFENWLFAKKFCTETVIKKLQLLKRLLCYCHNKKYINENPFVAYKLPMLRRPLPVYLTLADLKKITEHAFASERLSHVKDLFLFQCYTGLSYSDLAAFTGDKITRATDILFLKGDRVKTGEGYFLPWLPQAAAIAAKYCYTLPALSNQKYNAYLKEVGEITGIDKKLTTHIGRKTFAQMMLDKGYSQEAVAKMMGHQDFKMTHTHYARVGELRIMNEVIKMAS